MADFTIASKPESINFECPYCEAEVSIPWSEVEHPDCWSDEWPEVQCPDCGKMVELGDWTYD